MCTKCKVHLCPMYVSLSRMSYMPSNAASGGNRVIYVLWGQGTGLKTCGGFNRLIQSTISSPFTHAFENVTKRVALAVMLPLYIRRCPVRSRAGTSTFTSSLCSWFRYVTTVALRIRIGTPDVFILRYYPTLEKICRRCNIVKAARCSLSVPCRCKTGMVRTVGLLIGIWFSYV